MTLRGKSRKVGNGKQTGGSYVSEKMLTLNDLADRLNVTPKVVYGLRYRGEAPPAIRVGRELRFRLIDVEAWEHARRDNGGPRPA